MKEKKKKRIIYSIIPAIFIIVAAWGILKSNKDTEAWNADKIPYTIIKEEKYLNIKTSIDIRLESEISRDDLIHIAFELKHDGRKQYEKIFICYYLPGMVVDDGAWATSHFNPELEILIMDFNK